MRVLAHIALTVLVLAAGALGLWAMIELAPQPEVRPVDATLPLVRGEVVHRGAVAVVVRTHGTVVPRTQIELVPEVSGKVTWVSPALWSGGFFEAGEPLVRIDPRDFELQVTRAQAEVARAQVALALEQAEAATAREEWKKLEPGTEPSPLAVREPQLAQARAALQAAEAGLAKARLDLARATLSVPFAGRVRTKRVDVGQFVTAGAPLAELYAVDHAEVRLPLPDHELAFVDLPLERRGPDGAPGPAVSLSARFAGRAQRWRGRVVRVEGQIDPRTRMVYAVARVDDPYDRAAKRGGAPLAAGMFVQAEIEGRTLERMFAVSPDGVRQGDRVLVIEPAAPGDSETDGERPGHLRWRAVEVVRRERDRILVGGGLEDGDIVCVSPLELVTEGMRVSFVLNGGGEDGREGRGGEAAGAPAAEPGGRRR